MKKLRVALIFGGRSGEHEVSCMSAQEVLQAMDPERYEVVPIGISKQGVWMLPESSREVLEGRALQLTDGVVEVEGEPVTVLQDPARREIALASPSSGAVGWQFDVVFPLLHGPYGEDGTVQGLLELADIAYVGSGVKGSAIAMDKETMKLMFSAHGLPIVDYVVVKAHEWATDRERLLDEAAWLGFPSFAKPANLGSSVGVTKCVDLETLAAGIEEALRFDNKVIVEEGIAGREIECAVLGNEVPQASLPGEIIPGADFYDYDTKYVTDTARVEIPADLPEPVVQMIQKYSIRAFKAVDAAGLARVDFFYQHGQRGVMLNEINTMPGFTRISMYPKLWQNDGLSYSELIDRLIELALERHRHKARPDL